MVPSHFIIIPKMPYLPNGKIDRKALSRLSNSFPTSSLRTDLEDPFENLIASIWHEVLGVSSIPSMETSFFDLGGHSLLALKVDNYTKLHCLVTKILASRS